MATITIDPEMLAKAEGLRLRADSLREQAEGLDRFLATTYRRRASELELEAFLFEVQAGLPIEGTHRPAA